MPGKIKVVAVRAERGVSEERTERLYDVLAEDVAAQDPDGDAVAYYWDFGDHTFGANSPVQSRTFDTAGQYVVRCEVSDTKGGLASANVLVVVGSPSTFTKRPSVSRPTGTEMGAPVSLTGMPRTRPSVVDIAMPRTRFSPRCCATSRVSRIFGVPAF